MEQTTFKGDAAVYTGKVVSLHGGTFYEVKMLEGHTLGSLKLVTVAPKRLVRGDQRQRLRVGGDRRTSKQPEQSAERRTENSVETIGFYVTVIDGPRKGFLLGPYATHAEALANVERGRTLADKADARAHWYAFGTAKITGTQRGTVFGQ